MISIIIPAYRAERFLPDILDDVFRQSYADWELIVVSNGTGQEAQLALIEQWRQKDGGERVRVISIEQGSAAVARNCGIEAASGEWLTFVDADDRLYPNHLQLFIDAVKQCTFSPDIVLGGFKETRYDCKREIEQRIEEGDTTHGKRVLLDMRRVFVGFPWNKLYRTSFIQTSGIRFDSRYTFHEDGIAVLSWVLATNAIKIIPMTGYRYIVRPSQGNSSARYHADLAEAMNAMANLTDALKRQAGYTEEEIAEQHKQHRYIESFSLVRNLFKHGTPLTFGEQCAQVRRILYDDPEVVAMMKTEKRAHHNMFQRYYDASYKTGSPFIVALLFAAKYRVMPLFTCLKSQFPR